MKNLLRLLLLLSCAVLAVPAYAYYSVSVSAPGSATVSTSFYVSASGSDDTGSIISLTITLNGGYVCSSTGSYPTYSISTGGYATAPSAPGTATVLADLEFDYSATSSASVTILPPAPTISPPFSVTANVGTPFSYTIAGTNSPTSFSASGYPSWLSFTSPTLSGTPTATGTSSFTISATNAGGTGSATLGITVNTSMIPVISGPYTASATVGASFSSPITASFSPTSYSATGLPSGLFLNTTTGVITGRPSATGTPTATLGATNAYGTGTHSLAFTITSSAPTVTSPLTATATVGVYFTYQITGSYYPTSYSVSYPLPNGLTFTSATGLIAGTPSFTGVTSVTISATNATGTSSPVTLVITVQSLTAGLTTGLETQLGTTPGNPKQYDGSNTTLLKISRPTQ